MTVDFNYITATLSIMAVVVSIIALIIEVRGQRLALQINILLELSKQIDSTQLRLLRKNAASNLLKKELLNDELSEVLGFLSTVALLYERKAIDSELTYREFSYWMICYWLCSQEYIKCERASIDSLWVTLEKTVDNMLLIEKKAGHLPYNNAILEKFLQEEARLKVDV